jgi:Flp pilus assembly protein TadG
MLDRRATIAVATAMMAPMLLAITGLSVDVGYWYQQQESLQSAADAAALAAAEAFYKDGGSSTATSFTTATGATFAVAAANDATNNQYSFTSSGNYKVTVTATSGTDDTFTATATIPRGSFFAPVHGWGLTGMVPGSQTATAEAAYVAALPNSEIYTQSCASGGGAGIQVTGGAQLEATDGAVYAGCSTCPAISVSGSGKVIGADGVDTPASCVATNGGSQTTSTNNGSGYIGTQTSGTPNNGNTASATTNSAAQSDPLSGFNSANTALWDPGITVAAAPVAAVISYSLSSDVSSEWNPYTDASHDTACDTTFEGYSIPDGSCLTDAKFLGTTGYLTGLSSLGLGSSGTYGGYTLLANTSGGRTVIEGGLDGQINNSGNLNLDDSTYYIAGGMTMGLSNHLFFGTGSSTMSVTVTGGLTLNDSGGGYSTFYPGTYTISQAASGGTPSGYAFTMQSKTLTLEGGTYRIAGGMTIPSDSPTTYMESGLYEFEGASSTYSSSCSQYYCGSGAFYGGQGAITFGTATTAASTSGSATCGTTPSTWFFNGGLTISGGTSYVTFCPGIYYIKNGDLYITSGAAVTGTGVTFVLEGNAGFIFNGGVNINISGPTSSCISTSAYPETAYNGNTPYDGTDGEGICNVVIYQARGDTTTDYEDEGASTTFGGAIYAPSAGLVVGGGGALNVSSSGVPPLDVGYINDSGSGNISVSESNQSGGGGAGGPNNAPLLVQ